MGLFERLGVDIPIHAFWGLMHELYLAQQHAQIAWQASYAYELGDTVFNTPGGYWERVIVAGTSDTTEPAWPGTGSGDTVDNTVTWREWNGEWVVKEMIVDVLALDAGEETELDDLIAVLGNDARAYATLHGVLMAGEAGLAPFDSAQRVKDRLLETG
jgi:hypothetical protein